jgi:hypothetical protein
VHLGVNGSTRLVLTQAFRSGFCKKEAPKDEEKEEWKK